MSLGLGDYIKNREAHMKEEKEKKSKVEKKCTHIGLCEFPVVEGVLSNKKRVYYVF